MWIADGWKDYEVIDCSGGESWSVGENIFWSVRIPRLSGILIKGTTVEKDERPLPQKLKRRRRVGILQSPGAVEHQLQRPDLPVKALQL